MTLYICIKLHVYENISMGFRVIEWTELLSGLIYTKGHYGIKDVVGGDTVLNLCKSSNDSLFFIRSFEEISPKVSELLSGYEILRDGLENGWTDRRADGQGVYYRASTCLVWSGANRYIFMLFISKNHDDSKPICSISMTNFTVRYRYKILTKVLLLYITVIVQLQKNETP